MYRSRAMSSSCHSNSASPSTSTSSLSSSSTASSSPSQYDSMPSHPIQIGFTPAGSDALLDIFHAPAPPSSAPSSSACAYPSWPTRQNLSSTSRTSRGASYLSDEDLFGDFDDLSLNDVPRLCEAPAPPRGPEAWLARPPQPLPAAVRVRPTFSRKGSSKQRRVSKPMTTIQEKSV